MVSSSWSFIRNITYSILTIPLIQVISVINFKTYEKKIKHRFIDGESRAHGGEIDSYNAKTWWSHRTVDVLTLAESKFARCDIHSVLSEDGNRVVHDWIFLEERDAVNVAVFTIEGKFIGFEQKKYAIPGETLSPVGGFVDEGEAPWDAARREVLEELGLGSRKTMQMMTAASTNENQNKIELKALESLPAGKVVIDQHGLAIGEVPDEEKDWVFLGRYRTAANRGGGWIFSYLLKDAVPILPNGGTEQFKGMGDDESQVIHMLSLSDVEQMVIKGRFQEVKWAATIALSLLHLK